MGVGTDGVTRHATTSGGFSKKKKKNLNLKETEVSGRHIKYRFHKLKLYFVLQREYKIIERNGQRNWS